MQTEVLWQNCLIHGDGKFVDDSFFLFFFKFLEDMSPFCGATDTPILDFWWCLLWVSKPEWVLPYSSLVEAYVLRYTFPEIHLWCNTCQPLGGQHGSRAVSSTYLQGIGGTRNRERSCHRSQCEITQTTLVYVVNQSIRSIRISPWQYHHLPLLSPCIWYTCGRPFQWKAFPKGVCTLTHTHKTNLPRLTGVKLSNNFA